MHSSDDPELDLVLSWASSGTENAHGSELSVNDARCVLRELEASDRQSSKLLGDTSGESSLKLSGHEAGFFTYGSQDVLALYSR